MLEIENPRRRGNNEHPEKLVLRRLADELRDATTWDDVME